MFEEVEEPDPAVLDGPDFGAVGGPAHIGRIGGDAAVVGLGRGEGGAVRGEQAGGAHEAQDAVAADLVPGDKMEARVDLAVAFAGERRGGEIGADEGEQGLIVEGSFRAAFGVDFRRRQKGTPRRGGLGVKG